MSAKDDPDRQHEGVERSLWEELGLPEPADEPDGPAVDEATLREFHQNVEALSEESRRRIAALVGKYRAWSQALAKIALVDDRPGGHQAHN